MLEFKDVDVFYGDAQALKCVSIAVKEDTIVALVGANGAGKSTIIRTISGLMRPRNGTVKFLDYYLTSLHPENIVELGISLVPEGRRLFSRMTVLENLELGAYTSKARSSTAESIDRVLTLFPTLKGRLRDPAMVLSGGQQQMLAIGRAIMSLPHLLMLDEPSLGLAPLVIKATFDAIEALHQQGVTILLVEQNVRRSLELADMGFVIQTGTITLSGPSQILLTDPGVQKAFLGIGAEQT
jgi:branched-chain amino acid transport system ATP-binding protein